MALSVETGLFVADTADAVTTVSSSFQGKAIILFGNPLTASSSGDAGNAAFSYGFSDGTNHRCIAWAGDTGVGATNVGRSWRTDSALDILTDGTPTSARRITGISFGATSFDITWDGTPAAAYRVGYMLLGGSDITNVIVGTHTLDTATGPDSISGLAFQPNFGIFIHSMMTAAGTSVRAGGGIGFATSATKEFAMAWNVDDAQTMAATFDSVGYVNAAATMAAILDGAETVDLLADFTSWDSGGVTFNISNAPTAAWQVGYLLIKGGQWDVGTANLAASPFSVTSMTFQPKGLFMGATNATADATVTIHGESTVGAAISTSTEASISTLHSDVNDPTTTSKASLSTKILANVFSGSGGEWDFTSLNSNGWTITVATTADGKDAGWFAMADNAVAPTTTGSGWWGKAGNHW